MEKFPSRSTESLETKKKEALESIVHTDLIDMYKVLALLTYSGNKPVSNFIVLSDDREKFLGALNTLGLPYIETPFDKGGVAVEITIGKDLSDIERLVEIHRRRATGKDDAEVGRLYGFPDTAIEGFINNEQLAELPEEIADTDLGRFYTRTIAMRLSKEHWQDELKVVESWMESVRTLTPEYFEYLVSDRWVPPEIDSVSPTN